MRSDVVGRPWTPSRRAQVLCNLAIIAPLGDSELVQELARRRESRRMSAVRKEEEAKGPTTTQEVLAIGVHAHIRPPLRPHADASGFRRRSRIIAYPDGVDLVFGSAG